MINKFKYLRYCILLVALVLAFIQLYVIQKETTWEMPMQIIHMMIYVRITLTTLCFLEIILLYLSRNMFFNMPFIGKFLYLFMFFIVLLITILLYTVYFFEGFGISEISFSIMKYLLYFGTPGIIIICTYLTLLTLKERR